jgi:hypothetical protein
MRAMSQDDKSDNPGLVRTHAAPIEAAACQ